MSAHWDRGMLVFNLRHMRTLAWKTNVVVFSIIYSRVSWWALFKNKCASNKDTLVTYIGSVN